MDDFTEFKKEYYGEKICVITEGGMVCFDPDSLKEVVGAEHMTYDEYLDTQIRSLGKYRAYFAMCYFNFPEVFKGQIEKTGKKTVCFKRVYVEGTYGDGTIFDGKEDHVWMSRSGFESFQVGDCVEFSAEVYRYLKTGNGKLIDFGLRNPEAIRKIAAYELPSDDDLIRQELDQIICETCLFREHCDGVFCLRDPEELKRLQDQMFEAMKRGSES